MKKVIFLSLSLLLILPGAFLFQPEAEAIDITATGGWTETVDAADLTAGAGSDLNPTYTSAANATVVTITNCINNNDWWQVDVRRTDINWNASFTLRVRRTSAGTGGGAISGGTTFMTITTANQTFFSGRGNRTGINCQYRLLGMSINIPPDTYTTTVIYTVVDT